MHPLNWIVNMCQMLPNKTFKKFKILSFFKKRGVNEVKNSKIEKGLKNWILTMCHMPPKRIFKKRKIFEFFSKKGELRGVKKSFLLEKTLEKWSSGEIWKKKTEDLF